MAQGFTQPSQRKLGIKMDYSKKICGGLSCLMVRISITYTEDLPDLRNITSEHLRNVCQLV